MKRFLERPKTWAGFKLPGRRTPMPRLDGALGKKGGREKRLLWLLLKHKLLIHNELNMQKTWFCELLLSSK
jgi:hypothetical protein